MGEIQGNEQDPAPRNEQKMAMKKEGTVMRKNKACNLSIPVSVTAYFWNRRGFASSISTYCIAFQRGTGYK